jgi:hypothetical protein
VTDIEYMTRPRTKIGVSDREHAMSVWEKFIAPGKAGQFFQGGGMQKIVPNEAVSANEYKGGGDA